MANVSNNFRLSLLLTVFCLAVNLVAPRQASDLLRCASVHGHEQAPPSLRQACAKAEAVDPRREADPPVAVTAVVNSLELSGPRPLPQAEPVAYAPGRLSHLTLHAHASQGPPSV